jgi:hypothetical protein
VHDHTALGVLDADEVAVAEQDFGAVFWTVGGEHWRVSSFTSDNFSNSPIGASPVDFVALDSWSFSDDRRNTAIGRTAPVR